MFLEAGWNLPDSPNNVREASFIIHDLVVALLSSPFAPTEGDRIHALLDRLFGPWVGSEYLTTAFFRSLSADARSSQGQPSTTLKPTKEIIFSWVLGLPGGVLTGHKVLEELIVRPDGRFFNAAIGRMKGDMSQDTRAWRMLYSAEVDGRLSSSQVVDRIDTLNRYVVPFSAEIEQKHLMI